MDPRAGSIGLSCTFMKGSKGTVKGGLVQLTWDGRNDGAMGTDSGKQGIVKSELFQKTDDTSLCFEQLWLSGSWL